jgi:hypothetical protein
VIQLLDHTQIFTVVSGGCFSNSSDCIATRTIESLDIENLIVAPRFWHFFMFVLFIFGFLAYFGFYASFLCNFGFLFLFSG